MISCRVPWQNHDFGTSTNILARKSKAKGSTLLNSFKGLSFFLPDLFWNFTGRERKPGKLDFKHVWCILCFCTKKRTAKNQGLAKLRWWSPFFTGSLAAKNIPGSNQQGWDLTKKKDHWPGKNSRLSQKKLHLSRQKLVKPRIDQGSQYISSRNISRLW